MGKRRQSATTCIFALVIVTHKGDLYAVHILIQVTCSMDLRLSLSRKWDRSLGIKQTDITPDEGHEEGARYVVIDNPLCKKLSAFVTWYLRFLPKECGCPSTIKWPSLSQFRSASA